MPVARSHSKAPPARAEDDQIIDISHSIINHQTAYQPQQPPNMETREQSTGAIPKQLHPPPDYSFPPPRYEPRTQKPQKKDYGNLMKDLEAKVNKRIDEGIRAGMEQIISEIKKLKVTNESESSGANPTGLGDIPQEDPGAPYKRRENGHRPPPTRRLDFEGMREISESSYPANIRRHSREDVLQEEEEQDYSRPRPIRAPVQIDKWNIVFTGDPEKLYVEDFIFRIEYLQHHHRCSWKEIIRDFHRLLKDDAEDWYWLTIDTREIRSWEDLKEALLQEYKTNKRESDFRRELEDRKQRTGESLDAFFQAVKKLRCRVRANISEHEMIRILKSNLRQDIGIIVYPMNIYTVEQLRYECKEIERTFMKKESISSFPKARVNHPRQTYVNEVYHNTENEADLLEEIQYENRKTKASSNQAGSSGLICWDCRQPGHVFMDCPVPSRNLFCYRCGYAGVKSFYCPQCKENSTRGVAKPAKSHSTQTTAELEPMQAPKQI